MHVQVLVRHTEGTTKLAKLESFLDHIDIVFTIKDVLDKVRQVGTIE